MPEDVLDQLYVASPDDFVRLRNEQAKKLKSAGDEDAAREVKGLSRPTVVAWAINQLAREKSDQVSELLAAGQDLERAHRRLLSGVEAHGLQEAVKRRRELLHRLESEAAKILEKSGRSPDSYRAGIAATLQTASSEREAAELLQKGRLTKELPPPSGFGNLTGLNLVAAPTGGKRRAPKKEAAREVREAPVDLAAERKKRAKKDDIQARREREEEERRKQEAEARRALTFAKNALSDATRSVNVNERRAEAARKRASRAGEDAERISARAQRAEALAKKLSDEADALEKEAEEARRAAEKARAEVKAAEDRLEKL